jgi:hypothetical protein
VVFHIFDVRAASRQVAIPKATQPELVARKPARIDRSGGLSGVALSEAGWPADAR